MKKGMIILICVAAIVCAGLPVANGIIMEQTIKTAVENMNQGRKQPGFYHRVKILDYDRGLFSSRITWQIEGQSGFSKKDQPQVVLVDHAKHGFFSVETRTSLEKNPWYTTWVNDRLDGKDPLDIRTRVSATGSITSRIHMDAVSFEDQGKVFQVKPMDAQISTNKALETVAAKGTWQGAFQGKAFELGPVSFSADLHRLTNRIWEGRNTFLLEWLKIQDQNSGTLHLKKGSWEYDASSSEDNLWMTQTMTLHVDGMELNGQPLSEWAASLELKQVNVPALEKIVSLYSSILTRAGQALERQGGTPSDFQMVLRNEMARHRGQMMNALNGLLKTGLELEVSRLDIDLPQGKITGHMDLGLKKDINTSRLFMFVMQPEKIFPSFSLDAQLKIPTVFGRGNDWMTEPLIPGMATGLFISENDRLALDMQIRQDKLFLNGHQVVLDM